MSVAVLTANFGNHDVVAPLPAQDIDCDAILLSDEPCNVAGWHTVVLPPVALLKVPDFHGTGLEQIWKESVAKTPVILGEGAHVTPLSPRMLAKHPRCLPHLYTDAEIVVWIDGHVEVHSPSFIRTLIDHLGEGAIAAFRHPFHATISQEAALASTLPKYTGYDLTGQAKHYLDEGHPDGWGVWATGVMVRRPAETEQFGAEWLAQIERWGPEDQISLPYVLRKTGTRMVDLPAEGWRTWFSLHPHNDGTM